MNIQGGASRMQMTSIPPAGRALIVAAVAWNLGWKAASLWRAVKNDSKPWFAALLLSNTMGVLDGIYLFVVDRRRREDELFEEELLIVTGEPEQVGHPQET